MYLCGASVQDRKEERMASDISGQWFHKSTIISRDINKITVTALLTHFFLPDFLMTHLPNWKQHTSSYSEKPQAVIGV